MKKKLLFIVNPKSGTRSKERTFDLIGQHISAERYDHQVVFTQARGHATELSRQAVIDGVDYVVAVGGDGTVNETAQGLIHTSAAMGIIPMGSGNGLARHLQVPLDAVAALRFLNRAQIMLMDSATLNEKPFFCTAGVGFDAYIGLKFDQKKKRGFRTYVRTTLNEFITYRPEAYRLTINGVVTEQNAFLVSFANAAQYGNDAFISPEASVRDGKIDVCLLDPFPVPMAFTLGLKLFNRTLHQSKYLHVQQVTEATLERQGPAPVHLDGEPMIMEEKLIVKLLPSSLKVLAGTGAR